MNRALSSFLLAAGLLCGSTLVGCKAPPETVKVFEQGQKSLVNYVGNMDKIVEAILSKYEEAEKSKEDDLFERTLKAGETEGKLTAAVVMDLTKERDRVHKEIHDQRVAAQTALAKAKLDLYDYQKLSEEVRAYLNQGGIEPETANQIGDLLMQAVGKSLGGGK